MILYPVKMAFKFWSIKSKVDDRSLFRNFVYALNSNKTHTFILLTLYHLVGPIYTQRMEEGKWNDPVKNFAVLKKNQLIFMRTVAHVFILLHRKTLYFILSLNLSCTDLRLVHICNKHYILTGILQPIKTCIMP